MKRITVLLLMEVLLAAWASATLTYGTSYYQKERQQIGKGLGTNDPVYLFIEELEDIVTSSSQITLANGLTLDNAANNVLEINENSDELKLTFGSNTVTMSSTDVTQFSFGTIVVDLDQIMSNSVTFTLPTADGTNGQVLATDGSGVLSWAANGGGVSDLDSAYNGGSAVDVDTDALTLTVSDTDNNRALDLVQNDTTNNPDGLQITNAGTGDGIQFVSSGGGNDINGTGSSWYVSAAGAATFATVQTTGTTTFGDGTGTVAVNSSAWDITTAGAVSGVTTLSMSGDLTNTGGDVLLSNGKGIKSSTTTAETMLIAGYDVDNTTYRNVLTVTNGNTIAAEIGTGNETVAVNSTTWDVSTAGAFTGVADITGTAGEAMTITLAANGAADDLTLSVTGAQDSSVIVASAGTGTDAIKVNATAGGIDIDATNDDLSITNTANGAADDLTVAQVGNFDASLLITSAGSGTDALSLTTTANAGDIVVSSNDKIDMDSVGTFALNAAGDTLLIQVDSDGAGDDLTIKVDGDDDSSIILDSDGTAADAVKIGATNAAGGIDIDAGTNGIDILGTGGAVTVGTTKNAASAIALTANGGSSETIVVTNTQGTAAGAITLTSTAGGVTLAAGADDAVTLNPGTGGINCSGDKLFSYTVSITDDVDDESLLATQSGGVFTNQGDTNNQVYTLPTAAAGLIFTFLDVESGAGADLYIRAAASDTIAGGTANQYYACKTDAVSQSVTVVAISDVEWIVMSEVGTWVNDDTPD